MMRLLKIFLQTVGLGLMVILASRLEVAPQVNKAVTLNYNGLVWAASTTVNDVSELLVTNFGDYAGWQIDPAPATRLTDGMTVNITDVSAQKLDPTTAKNYQARKTELATPPKPPAPKPQVPKPQDVHAGLATWYRFGDKLTTASRSYPKGTKLKVIAVNSGKSVEVTVNDYGPSVLTGVDLDLNVPAFEALAPLGAGKIKIKYYKVT